MCGVENPFEKCTEITIIGIYTMYNVYCFCYIAVWRVFCMYILHCMMLLNFYGEYAVFVSIRVMAIVVIY